MAGTIGAEGCVDVFGVIEDLASKNRIHGQTVRTAMARARNEVERTRNAILGQEGMGKAA
jgi:hypothetical protein